MSKTPKRIYLEKVCTCFKLPKNQSAVNDNPLHVLVLYQKYITKKEPYHIKTIIWLLFTLSG